MGLVGGGVLWALGLMVWRLTAAAAQGRLRMNVLAGIRTGDTMRSEQAWRLGHEAALPGVRRLAIGCGVVGAALVAAGLTSGSEPNAATIALFLLGYAGVLAALWPIVRAANIAARNAPADTAVQRGIT